MKTESSLFGKKEARADKGRVDGEKIDETRESGTLVFPIFHSAVIPVHAGHIYSTRALFYIWCGLEPLNYIRDWKGYWANGELKHFF